MSSKNNNTLSITIKEILSEKIVNGEVISSVVELEEGQVIRLHRSSYCKSNDPSNLKDGGTIAIIQFHGSLQFAYFIRYHTERKSITSCPMYRHYTNYRKYCKDSLL